MDNEKQKDEIAVLESIYSSEEFSYCNDNGQYTCLFMIFINLPLDSHILYKDVRYEDEPIQKIKISYLPPLTLNIILPKLYPLEVPPEYCLHSSWLDSSQLSLLCNKLDNLWEKNSGQEILFTWVSFLQDEALDLLLVRKGLNLSIVYTCYKEILEQDHKKELKLEVDTQPRSTKILMQESYDKRAIVHYPHKTNPIHALIKYDDTQSQIQFDKNFYTCKICFVDKLGADSTQFMPCGHIYCKDCIRDYIEVRIKDCNVQNIVCPEEKCNSETTYAQVKDLVSSELFTKYDSILLNTAIDTMDNTIYCPRRNCQYPVICEPNELIAKCPNCLYAFCILCKMIYHGIEPCKTNTLELLKKYQNGSAETRMQLERYYNKQWLQTLVNNAKSDKWIKTHSQRCPKCQANIEKIDGCNKMVCQRCNAAFCWTCFTILDHNTAYEHFQNRKSRCYNMLYYNTEVANIAAEEDQDYLHRGPEDIF